MHSEWSSFTLGEANFRIFCAFHLARQVLNEHKKQLNRTTYVRRTLHANVSHNFLQQQQKEIVLHANRNL